MPIRGGADQAAVTEQIGRHGVIASNYLVLPKSGDSWRAFYNRNSIGFGPEWNRGQYEPEHIYRRRRDARRVRREHQASVEQRAWEDARNERMRLAREASDAEWAAAERKVQEAEAAYAKRLALEAEEHKARQAAAQAEAAKRRRHAEAEAKHLRAQYEAQFYAEERANWVRTLWEAIALCEGTRYASLIPQMQGDIAKIEAMPPGKLPWRFDQAAFYQHFYAFQAQIDAGTYRPV